MHAASSSAFETPRGSTGFSPENCRPLLPLLSASVGRNDSSVHRINSAAAVLFSRHLVASLFSYVGKVCLAFSIWCLRARFLDFGDFQGLSPSTGKVLPVFTRAAKGAHAARTTQPEIDIHALLRICRVFLSLLKLAVPRALLCHTPARSPPAAARGEFSCLRSSLRRPRRFSSGTSSSRTYVRTYVSTHVRRAGFVHACGTRA